MRFSIIFLALKILVVSCRRYTPSTTARTVYYFDVNQLHEPLTMFDKVSKTVKYCVYINNRTLDVNYLTGTWYNIFKFAKGLTGSSNENCKVIKFSRPTKADLDGYKTRYDLQNETFTFDDGSVLMSQSIGENSTLDGLVIGDKTAKYYFLDPKSHQRLSGVYDVLTFKPVNNDYMIHYACNMRGHIKFLWSRRRDQNDEELKNIIKPLYELEDKGNERYCKKRTVVSTTPYF